MVYEVWISKVLEIKSFYGRSAQLNSIESILVEWMEVRRLANMIFDWSWNLNLEKLEKYRVWENFRRKEKKK